MRRVLYLGALFAALAGVSEAQGLCQGMDTGVAPMSGSYEKKTVSGTAVTLTSTKYRTATQTADIAIVRVETNNVRYNTEGSTPTATEGILAEVSSGSNTTIVVCGRVAIANFKVIRVTSDATIYVEYYSGNP